MKKDIVIIGVPEAYYRYLTSKLNSDSGATELNIEERSLYINGVYKTFNYTTGIELVKKRDVVIQTVLLFDHRGVEKQAREFLRKLRDAGHIAPVVSISSQASLPTSGGGYASLLLAEEKDKLQSGIYLMDKLEDPYKIIKDITLLISNPNLEKNPIFINIKKNELIKPEDYKSVEVPGGPAVEFKSQDGIIKSPIGGLDSLTRASFAYFLLNERLYGRDHESGFLERCLSKE